MSPMARAPAARSTRPQMTLAMIGHHRDHRDDEEGLHRGIESLPEHHADENDQDHHDLDTAECFFPVRAENAVSQRLDRLGRDHTGRDRNHDGGEEHQGGRRRGNAEAGVPEARSGETGIREVGAAEIGGGKVGPLQGLAGEGASTEVDGSVVRLGHSTHRTDSRCRPRPALGRALTSGRAGSV